MSPLLLCLTLAACGGGGSSPNAQTALDAAGTTAPASAAVDTSAALPVAADAPAASTNSTSTDTALAMVAVPAQAMAASGGTTTPSGPAASTTAFAGAPVNVSDAGTNTTSGPVDTVVASAADATAQATQASAPLSPAGQDASQYTLTFSDEFNTGTSVDAAKWSSDIYYKANNPTKNYNVAGGALNIWPALDSNGAFFDRTVVSAGRFSQQYGFFEVEAKLPVGAGLHPVISLTANNGPEIAIMHAYSGAPNGAWANTSLHPVDYVVTAMSGPDAYVGEFRARNFRSIPDLSAAFHKYGIRWDANTVTYYFDGVQVGQPIAHNAIRTPMYFYIGLWMVNEETSPATGSGTLSLSNPYTPTGSGNALKVNYVRAWRFKN
jgi:beta-glucanase (GH16 family)